MVLKLDEKTPIKDPILIVEDSNFIHDMMVELLETNGFQNIDIANNGYEALEMVKNKKYSIILMDILMPNMDGLKAIEEIKNANPKQVIIVITALINPTIKKKCKELGVEEFINKPFHSQNLIRMIMKYI